MALKQYINEAEKQYNLRLKTIVPLDDSVMDRIENYLVKYNPLSISRPNKTILQREPLDFPNVDAAEVYIVDMTFGLPAAPHVIRADLRKLLDAPENFVFVRNRNEPGEIESERLNALADIELEAAKRGLKPAALRMIQITMKRNTTIKACTGPTTMPNCSNISAQSRKNATRCKR